MKNWVKFVKKKWIIYGILFGACIMILAAVNARKEKDALSLLDVLENYMAEKALQQTLEVFLPFFSFCVEDNLAVTPREILAVNVLKEIPIYGYYSEREKPTIEIEDDVTYQLLLEEGMEEAQHSSQEDESQHSLEEYALEENQREIIQEQQQPSLEELFLQENSNLANAFIPHEKINHFDWEAMKQYETLVSTFYAIDATTMAGSDQLNAQKLLEKDISIQKKQDAPQILIYHTHSKEAFADSTPGDASQSVVGVGERLGEILSQEYGYNVLHHTAEYDTIRDEAYAKSLPAIEKLLEENPSIEVIIDLHRDSGAKGTRRAVEIDGRPMATFMLFNGLSRTRKTGNITYLENPNLDDNLAFSFQMQVKAGEYYPGLTRKIYLKGYRYNMHLLPRTLLIELGDENTTVEEAMNTCDPLAHILNMVLSKTE